MAFGHAGQRRPHTRVISTFIGSSAARVTIRSICNSDRAFAHNRSLLRLVILVAPVATLFGAGCTKSVGASSDGASTVTDSGGVIVVQNHRPLWSDQKHWRIDSVPLTHIGNNDKDVQQQFRILRGAYRLSNGNVVVATTEDIRLFDANSHFIKTIAREGGGPGEFRALSNVTRIANDSILASQAVAEGGIKNVVFAPDGSLAYEEHPDMKARGALGPWRECATIVFPDRSRLGCKSDPTIPASDLNRQSKVLANGLSSPGPGRLRQLMRWHVISGDMQHSYPIGIGAGIEQFGVEVNGRNYGFFPHPFYSHSLIAAGGHPVRIAVITNPEFNIEVWTPAGKLERLIRRDGGRRLATAQEKSDVVAEMRSMLSEYHEDDPVRINMIMGAIPTPDSLPAAQGLVVGDAGEILVMREGMLALNKQTLYDVFDVDGRWLGELRFARRSRITEIGSDYITTIRYDDLDAPHVEVFRLHK